MGFGICPPTRFRGRPPGQGVRDEAPEAEGILCLMGSEKLFVLHIIASKASEKSAYPRRFLTLFVPP